MSVLPLLSLTLGALLALAAPADAQTGETAAGLADLAAESFDETQFLLKNRSPHPALSPEGRGWDERPPGGEGGTTAPRGERVERKTLSQ